MRINNNIAAYNAYRNVTGTNSAMSKSLEKLSSGNRINRAADDAAGLVISQKLRAQSSGLRTAIRNVQDGISVVQVAEGSMTEIHSMLNRMRDLAVQAANTGANDATAVTAAQAELDALVLEIDHIASETEFAGVKLLDGSYTAKTFQVGAASGDTVAVTINDMDATSLTVNLLTLNNAATAITDIDAAIAAVSAERGSLGALQNRFESMINNLQVSVENLTASESRIRDADMASEMITFTRNQILQQAGMAMLAQANSVPQSVLKLLQ
jgi:flagellin